MSGCMSRTTLLAASCAAVATLSTTLALPASSDADVPTAPTRAAAEPTFSVLSYNINNPGDAKPFNWENREPAVLALIEDQGADIIGIQEARRTRSDDSASDLKEALTDGTGIKYEVIEPSTFATSGSDGVYGDYRTVPKLIFYRADRFQEVREAPDAVELPNPYQPSEAECYGNSDNRSVMWAVLEDKNSPTHQRYFVANTHLPAGDPCYQGRNVEAKKVMCTIGQENTAHLPAIVTGDFNYDDHRADPQAEENAISIMEAPQSQTDHAACSGMTFESGGYELARSRPYSGTTPTSEATHLSNWGASPGSGNRKGRIDYIFLARRFEVTATKIATGTRAFKDGTVDYPSDHLPIRATVRIVP